MILYICVRKSYFQISDFYTYCSVIYVIYNHNIIKMYVLSYHLSIKIIFGVSITILSIINFILKGIEWAFRIVYPTKTPAWCTRAYWHLKVYNGYKCMLRATRVALVANVLICGQP